MRHLLLATPFALLATPAAASTGEPVNPWVALAYLISGVFFILALRGLSSPATSRTANRFGMVGMLIAVVTTLVTHVPGLTIVVYDDGPTQTWFELDWATTSQILIAIAIGAAIGLVTARRIAMTAMPELVAAFHSLVGLAAVLVGWAAYLNPGAFGLLTEAGIAAVSKVEMGLGIAIGAITFSGSVIAFAKLSGKMSGSPILLPARHVINLGVLAAIIVLTALFALSGPADAADAQIFLQNRMLACAAPDGARRPAFFSYRVAARLHAAARARRRLINDNAYADRCAPPGRNPGRGRQR